MKNSKSTSKSTLSTKEVGDRFEALVAEAFRCIQGASVKTHVKIAGKDVDIYVVIRRPFSPEFRIVVDAKDYSRVISRERAASEFSSYYPLIADGHADQFMLVTRRGIVANAAEIFNGRSSVHQTISDLQNAIVDPTHLINNMSDLFSIGNLDQYYIKAKCQKIDLDFAIKNYDKAYSEFISSCISDGITELNKGRMLWRHRKNFNTRKSVDNYSETEFKNIIEFRQPKIGSYDELEPVVWKWLKDEKINLGIALLGTYGTGKSSFAKRIAHRAAQDFKMGRSDRIPLLIELRDFGSHQSIEGLLTHTLVNKHSYSNGSYALFQKMNAAGRYFVILDGFDEMKQGLTRDALMYNFGQLGSLSTGRAKVMLCGRPTMFESETEQTLVLTGQSGVESSETARYIPIEIAPLQQRSILEMITAYVKTREPNDASNVSSKFDTLKEKIIANSELMDLLSRPVHVPMFVTVLPDFDGDINKLGRGYLYETFIRKIIFREVLRLPPAYQDRYTTEQRFNFVGSLAFEMAKRGEARSIRRSEIPPSIITPFVKQGEIIEMAARDLVAACFLEQKPPDILVFGHKSFLEFLTAHFILGRIRNETRDGKLQLIYPTPEISSFVLDLCETDDLIHCLKSSEETREFVIACMLHATVNFRFRTYYRLVPSSASNTHRRSRVPFRYGIRLAVSERISTLLALILETSTIETLCSCKVSTQMKHAVFYLMYMIFMHRVGKENTPEVNTEYLNSFSEDFWNCLENLSTTDTTKLIVDRMRKDLAEFTSEKRTTRSDVYSEEVMREMIDFLMRHQRQSFEFIKPLHTIGVEAGSDIKEAGAAEHGAAN